MLRNFLCGNSSRAVVESSSSTSPLPCTVRTMTGDRGQGKSTGKTVVKLPHKEPTPSVETTSTGIDDSHVSKYKAIFELIDQVDNGTSRCEHHGQLPRNAFASEKYTSQPDGGLLHTSQNGEPDFKYDDCHCKDCDFCFMNRNVDTSLEGCPSTNALILEPDRFEGFSESDPETDSNQSSMTGDIYMENSSTESASVEHKSSPPVNRISALTEAIAMKQSDVAVQFCSMIKQMKIIVETMHKMQDTNDSKEMKATSSQYVKNCQHIHATATKMAKKQVLLAHQSTRYVERLEQEMLDLQSKHQLLLLSGQMIRHSVVPEAVVKLPPLQAKHDIATHALSTKKSDKVCELHDCDDDVASSGTTVTKFCIQEISFRNSIVVDVAELGATDGENQLADDENGSLVGSGDASNLRFFL